MKKIFLLLFLIGIIVISGCIRRGGDVGSSNGVIISSFYADPSEVEPGDTVYLLMDIENVGGEKATGIRAELIGLPNQWIISGPTGVPSELYPPEGRTKGEVATIEWVLTAPSQETTITYPAEGIVTYYYETHYETLVRIANRDWIRSLPQDERQKEISKLGPVETSEAKGPIHATIKMASEATYAETTSRLVLDIQNVGSGLAENDQVIVTVTGEIVCPLENPVKLIRGQSRQIRCESNVAGVEKWKNIRVDVDLEYNYVLRKAVDITVTGSTEYA